MKTLQDSADLIGQTTSLLRGDAAQRTPDAGIALIEQWLQPLETAQNTKPVADMLGKLKTLLQTQPVNPEAVHLQLNQIAELTAALATTADGDIESSLGGMADAIRQAADAAKAGQ